jgi:hypothetical protein
VVGVSRVCRDGIVCPAIAGPPTVAYVGLTVEGHPHVIGVEVGIAQNGQIVPLDVRG